MWWPDLGFATGAEGSDLAGVVLEIGDGVSDFAVGDEVLGFSFQRSSHAARSPSS
jgi:NADPH:quinone reductase